jgi:hypothetical protein
VVLPGDSASVDLAGLVTAAAGPITAITQQVTIDRSSVETRGIRAGVFWVLETDFGSHHVSVAAGNWSTDDLRLERISDLGPYFAGTRQLLSR